MSRYRRVKTSVYSDAKFRRLTRPHPNGQSLWLYLLTAPESMLIPGVVVAGRAALSESLGWDLEGFDKAFQEVSSEGLAIADWEARVVWLPNGPPHNPPQSTKVLKGWSTAWSEIPECELKSMIFEDLLTFSETLQPAFRKAFHQAFEIAKPITGAGAVTGAEEKTSSEDRECAAWIFETIRKTLPTAKQPDIDRWATVIRLMREHDHRSHEQIRDLFSWAHNDQFWRGNILSPAKLREKWDTLTLQSQRGKPVASPKRNRDYNQTGGMRRADS